MIMLSNSSRNSISTTIRAVWFFGLASASFQTPGTKYQLYRSYPVIQSFTNELSTWLKSAESSVVKNAKICEKSHERQKSSRSNLVMQQGISHPDDHEPFLMKEMGANATHYPLCVRVHNDDGVDDKLTGAVSKRTVDEVRSTSSIRRSAKPPTTTPRRSTAPPCQHRFLSPVL